MMALLPSALAWGSESGIYSQDVRIYVSVTLRNVNLRYRLGMSIWGHARNVNLRSRSGIGCHWNVHYMRTLMEDGVGGDVSWRWRTGRTVRLALRNVRIFGGVKCRNECWTQPTASDSDKEKKQRGQSTVEAKRAIKNRTRKSSKVKSTYGRVSTSQVLFFWLPLNQECKISDNCSVRPTRMRDAWREASYACVFLVATWSLTQKACTSC